MVKENPTDRMRRGANSVTCLVLVLPLAAPLVTGSNLALSLGAVGSFDSVYLFSESTHTVITAMSAEEIDSFHRQCCLQRKSCIRLHTIVSVFASPWFVAG